MKNTIKNILHKAGWKMGRVTVMSSHALQLAKILQAHNINVVFDIGSNTGQFAIEMREFGYTGKIISFEPLPDAYKALLNASAADDKWMVHERCAVGAEAGSITINVAGNSVSSSILPMLSSHLESAPESKYTHAVESKIITLDSIYSQYCDNNDNVLIKIDTQGFEWQVLDGANQALSACKAVLLELSLVPLYEGQRLWQDFMTRLLSLNFAIYAIQPNFVDANTGQTMQFDGIFIKNNNE
jgi:FkbM family methyltransferase